MARIRSSLRLAVLAIALGTGVTQAVQAAVNDILPSDYYPIAPGTTTFSVYAFDREYAGPYARGSKQFDGRLDNTTYALRAVRGHQIGDTVFGLIAVLPWTDTKSSPALLHTALGREASGFADLRLGVTAWLVNDKDNANFMALSGMVIAPTGSYRDGQVLNAGENRWRYVIFGGWQKDLAPRWLFELSPEVVFYGDNDAYAGRRTLEQSPSYALTGYLRWRTQPTWHLFMGGQVNRGGETRIDGVKQNNPANNERLMAGMVWLLPDRQQLVLRVSRDYGMDNGFSMNREILFRYQKAF